MLNKLKKKKRENTTDLEIKTLTAENLRKSEKIEDLQDKIISYEEELLRVYRENCFYQQEDNPKLENRIKKLEQKIREEKGKR